MKVKMILLLSAFYMSSVFAPDAATADVSTSTQDLGSQLQAISDSMEDNYKKTSDALQSLSTQLDGIIQKLRTMAAQSGAATSLAAPEAGTANKASQTDAQAPASPRKRG